MSLLEKLKKNSTIKETAYLEKSDLFNKKDLITTPIYAMNIALSGDIDGGFVPGLTMWAGPSKHFKTLFSLIMAKSYMDKYPEAALLFYDSEFGTPISYFDSVGIDKSRVIHTPLLNIEEFKFDIMQQLQEIEKTDKLIIVVDSIGNMASKKEIDDAIDGKSVADMTRAKQIKSCFRMITPYLTKKDIPMVVVNHIYMCGTEKMTVSTPHGPISIKDIKIGDIVLTKNGYEEVSFTTTNENASITEIELENGEILEFTDGHRFLVNDEWVYVADLLPGMSIDSIS